MGQMIFKIGMVIFLELTILVGLVKMIIFTITDFINKKQKKEKLKAFLNKGDNSLLYFLISLNLVTTSLSSGDIFKTDFNLLLILSTATIYYWGKQVYNIMNKNKQKKA